MERAAQPARTTARIAGASYLVTILARICADGMVRDRLVLSSDAAATAGNILAHQDLFRLGFAADVVAFASYIALTAFLYLLLEPVHRGMSIVAAFFGLTSSIAQAVSSVFHLAALHVLGGSEYLNAFTTPQLQTLALILMKVRSIAYHNIGLVFLGFYCITIGWLFLRSRLLPRVVGVLTVLGGIAYMPFLSPPLAASLLPYLLIPAGVGQIALMLWLLVMGVNADRSASMRRAQA
jgi:hypothetical protein